MIKYVNSKGIANTQNLSCLTVPPKKNDLQKAVSCNPSQYIFILVPTVTTLVLFGQVWFELVQVVTLLWPWLVHYFGGLVIGDCLCLALKCVTRLFHWDCREIGLSHVGSAMGKGIVVLFSFGCMWIVSNVPVGDPDLPIPRTLNGS